MNNKEAVFRLLTLLKPYLKSIILIMLCLLVSTGINLCIPLISKGIMDQGFVERNESILIKLVVISFILWIINDFLDLIKERKRIRIWSAIRYKLTEKAYEHIMKVKMSAFDKMNVTEINSNLSIDINNMSAIADGSLFFVIMQIFSMIGGIIGLLLINMKLTFIVLLFIPIKTIIIKFLARKRKNYVDTYISQNRKFAQWFGDSVGGVKEIRILNLFEQKKREFVGIQSKVIESQNNVEWLSQWNIKIDSVLIQVLIMTIYIMGAEMVFSLELSIGSIFAFITYSTFVTTPITAILNIGYLLAGIIPSTKRYYKFMDIEEENYKICATEVKNGDIEFDSVFFSYDNANDILTNINLKIPVNSKIALMGINGSGKSTLIDLLLRVYETNSGRISLGGVDINAYSIKEYRKLISVVSQKIYLFNDSILNNICLGKKVESEELWKIIKDSGLSNDIEEEMLNQTVGNNGCMLSGGQKQKIALARALIDEASVFILDEFTSNVDLITEKQINKLLKGRLKEKTVIIATHSVSVLKDVDTIALINGGKIEMQGTYDELLKNSKIFREIIKMDNYE